MIVPKAKKSDATRQKIVRAFDECVASAGYAHTKLVDIADAAGLATPHLRYYFKNKESILEYQYEQLVAGFERAVLGITAGSPYEWFEALAHLVFDSGRRSTRAHLLLLEANMLVARSERMRSLKQRYDSHMLQAFETQLEATTVDDPGAVAAMIFHQLSGLILNNAFESKTTRARAIPQFVNFVVRVAGQNKSNG